MSGLACVTGSSRTGVIRQTRVVERRSHQFPGAVQIAFRVSEPHADECAMSTEYTL